MMQYHDGKKCVVVRQLVDIIRCIDISRFPDHNIRGLLLRC